MSTDPPNDQPPRRMPWEPEPPAPGSTPPEPPPPPSTGWTPPSPTDPTTVWSPQTPESQAPPPPGQPASSPPEAPPPPGQGALLSSAPVGWAPPPPAAVEIAPGLTFADTGSRVVAYIVDVILLGIVVSIVVTIIGVGTTDFTDSATAMTGISSPAWSLAVALLGMLYFVLSWTGGRRATIGQRIFNIQVGNAFDGKALSLEQAIRRWLGLGSWIGLFSIVPSLVGISQLIELLWVIVLLITTATSPTKQGLHDRFANTALVSPSGQGASGLAKACLVIVVALGLLFVLAIVALILVGSQVSTILSRIGDSI